MFMSDVVMTEKKAGVLSKSMKLVYVYAMATGAIFTFMCYWDGIFMWEHPKVCVNLQTDVR